MATKKKDKDKLDKLMPILVRPDEVMYGDLLARVRRVGSRQKDFEKYDLKDLNQLVIAGTTVAKDLELCRSLWRSHVHINGVCYDIRHDKVMLAVPRTEEPQDDDTQS